MQPALGCLAKQGQLPGPFVPCLALEKEDLYRNISPAAFFLFLSFLLDSHQKSPADGQEEKANRQNA